jgi:hypothetical protein
MWIERSTEYVLRSFCSASYPALLGTSSTSFSAGNACLIVFVLFALCRAFFARVCADCHHGSGHRSLASCDRVTRRANIGAIEAELDAFLVVAFFEARRNTR